MTGRRVLPFAFGGWEIGPIEFQIAGFLSGDAVFALIKRKELRSELAMTASALAEPLPSPPTHNIR